MNGELGKKVFFLYPPSVIQEEMIKELIYCGYEAYILRDYEKTLKLLNEYNDSILFINIDTVLQEPDWEQYIKYIMANPLTKNVQIGILTYNDNEEWADKYINQLKISFGYIKLNLGFKKSFTIILKALESVQARGRRKYVRIKCDEIHKVTFQVKIKNNIYLGTVCDISSAGMSCFFNQDVELEKNAPLKNIQLLLKGIRCVLSGFVAACRQEGKKIYIVMFEDRPDPKARERIYNYIFDSLQYNINVKLKELG